MDVFNGLLSSEEGVKGQNGNGLKLHKLSYVIGVSDNGGSTSEILRVFGGPGIGDVRSKLAPLFTPLMERRRRRLYPVRMQDTVYEYTLSMSGRGICTR